MRSRSGRIGRRRATALLSRWRRATSRGASFRGRARGRGRGNRSGRSMVRGRGRARRNMLIIIIVNIISL
jgi:hypothetical protein